MRLILLHPEVALRSCQDCCTWQYEANGEPMRRPKIGGPRVPRPAYSPPPCRTCPKIPLGMQPTPGNAIVIDDQVWAAWEYYRRCRAVGRFPDDETIEIVAAAIRSVEDEADRRREDGRLTKMAAMLATARVAEIAARGPK